MKVLESAISKNGQKIELLGNENHKKTLVIGVFHGDEPQGQFLIDNYLKKNDSSLLFIPCLNPDGMQLGQRTNANGVDLNRNFPTKNWGENHGDNATCDDEKSAYYGGISGGSEIETQFLIDTIIEMLCNISLFFGSAQMVNQILTNLINNAVF